MLLRCNVFLLNYLLHNKKTYGLDNQFTEEASENASMLPHVPAYVFNTTLNYYYLSKKLVVKASWLIEYHNSNLNIKFVLILEVYTFPKNLSLLGCVYIKKGKNY